MSRPASGKPPEPPTPQYGGLIAPDEAAWGAMTPRQQDDFLIAAMEAHEAAKDLMSAGRPHTTAKNRAMDELSLHFRTVGRGIYVADEMMVVYPGRETFEPDLLAVLDVEQPEEDERLAWVVAKEGKGPDLILEILHHGNRHKDLVRNVTLYAELGIREYFVYDRMRYELHGYRLPGKAAVEYRQLRPQLGLLHSEVLGLNLAILEGRLRFFAGHAELGGSSGLITRLSSMMEGAEERAKGAEARAEQAEARARQEAARAEQEAARFLGRTREAILALLRARQIPVDAALQQAVAQCADAALLEEGFHAAMTAPSSEALRALLSSSAEPR